MRQRTDYNLEKKKKRDEKVRQRIYYILKEKRDERVRQRIDYNMKEKRDERE